MDDRRLKEYALNIFNNVSGYSLQKAFDLFPKYYPKIAFYYSELITKKQEELTARTIQSVGITRAHTLVRFARETNFTMQKYHAYSIATIQSFDTLPENVGDYKNYIANTLIKTGDIADNIKNIAKLNNKCFHKIIDEAKKYGFSNILDEAKYYLAMNNILLKDILKATKDYVESSFKLLYK